MAIRIPLVSINGEISTLPAADNIIIGVSEDVGVPYRLINQLKNVPTDFQYLITGTFTIASGSTIRTSGQVVVI